MELSLYDKMRNVVEEVVKHYQLDFFNHDIKAMEVNNGTFAWYVHDSGTHFFHSTDAPDVIEQQRGWFQGVQWNYGNRPEVLPNHRLYLCNQHTGEMKRIYRFDEVEFTVIEEAV